VWEFEEHLLPIPEGPNLGARSGEASTRRKSAPKRRLQEGGKFKGRKENERCEWGTRKTSSSPTPGKGMPGERCGERKAQSRVGCRSRKEEEGANRVVREKLLTDLTSSPRSGGSGACTTEKK